MLVTPFEHAARAPVPARTRPRLLKYRIGYRRAASKPPFEYRTRHAVGTRVPQSAGQLGSARPHSPGADLV